MSLYEGMFVMDNRQANRDWDGTLEKLKGLLAKHGAEIVRCDKWGERKLAYEMDGRRRGTYVLAYFNAQGTAVNAIYRECELSELVLRALMVKVEAIPSEDKLKAPEEFSPRRGRDFGDDRFDRPSRPRDARPSAAPVAPPPEAEDAEETKE